MGLMDRFRQYTTVDVAGALALLDEGATMVDVRGQAEWRRGHARQAKHLPLDSLSADASRVLPDQATPVLCVCAHGMRSARAAEALARLGYMTYSLKGGMAAWQRAGQQVIGPGGRPGEVQ